MAKGHKKIAGTYCYKGNGCTSRFCEFCCNGDKYEEAKDEYYNRGTLQELVNKAESFEWIPVSERLPEQSLNSVLGWDAYRERCCFVQYYNNEWILGNHETVKIIAWMPLPEPYKEKEKR